MPLFKKKVPEPELPPLPPLPEEELPPVPEAPEFKPPKPVTPTPPPPEIPEKAKVFIRIDKYKEVMKLIERMQDKTEELQKTLEKISAIKDREAEIIEGWNTLLAEAKEKIDEINSKLLKPEA